MRDIPSTAGSATGRPFSFPPGLTRAKEAAALGISERHYRRLREAERAGTAEWSGPGELPYVELAEAPRAGLHYRLDADELSRLPECPFRIGRGRGGSRLQVAHRDDRKGERPAEPKRCPHKFRPRRPKKAAG